MTNATKPKPGSALPADASPVDASKGQRVRLHAGMTPDQALHAIIGETVRHLLNNVPGIIRDPSNPEFIHQARIALRRLRSAQKAFKLILTDDPWQALTPEIKWLATLLGNARDLDVLLTETLPTIAAAYADSSDFTPLEKAARQYRSELQQQLISALKSKRYQKLVFQLVELQNKTGDASLSDNEDLLTFVENSLKKNKKRVHRQAKDWKNLNQEQRHDLRKRIKKLRYSAEFFSSLYKRKAVDRYLRKLARLQQSLGTMNDATATRKMIALLIKRDSTLHYPAGIVAGWQICEAKLVEAKMERGIGELKAAKPFW